MNRTISIEHNGKTYAGTIMTIKRTSLGWEDHGLFTAMLHCEGGGSGVSIGGHVLDGKPESSGGERTPSAYGMAHIAATMQTAGVREWEHLPGVQIIVLHEGKSIFGSVAAGFAGLQNDKVLIFKEHAEQFGNES